MQDPAHSGPTPVTIWVWLLVLVVAGLVLLFFEEMSHTTITILLMAIAAVKATLVLRHYMHLKAQPAMLYVIAFTPVLLAIVMALILIPDVAYR